MRRRNVISHQRIENKGKSMIDYVIEIENFNLTMINVDAGVRIPSKTFLVNWSEFSVDVKKVDQKRKEKLSVFLTNHSDWMVRAKSSLSVGDSSLYRSSGERLWKAGAERFSGKIPFSRCTTKDLLTPDGSLKIRVRIELHAENFPGGSHDKENQLELKLHDVEARLLQLEAKGDGGVQVEEVVEETPGEGTMQVKCPVCLKEVVKPMRLQQCPQVRLPSKRSFLSRFIRVTSSVMTATATSTKLLVRTTGSCASPASPSTAVVRLFSRISSISRTPAKMMPSKSIEFLCQNIIQLVFP